MNTRKLYLQVIVLLIALLAPGLCSAQIQTILVGPDGQYATVLEALAEVLTAPQTLNVIKVQAGVNSNENLYFPPSWTSGTISISGSWDAPFNNQSFDPADTVISGGQTHRVIDIKIAGGTVILSSLSIVDGAHLVGAGIYATPTNDAAVHLVNLAVHDNVADSAGDASGAGIYSSLQDTSTLQIKDCDVYANTATGGGKQRGGGIYVGSSGGSAFSIIDTAIHNNDAFSTVDLYGAGIYLGMGGTSIGTVTGCVVDGNTGSSLSTPIAVNGVGLSAWMTEISQLSIERTRVVSNGMSPGWDHHQARIRGSGDSVVRITDSIVADGRSDGLALLAEDQSVIHATNLTVAVNDRDGIYCDRNGASTAVINLSNSVVSANGVSDLNIASGPVTQTANIIGIDPEFVDMQDLDFRVEIGSVAEDAGVIAPTGGLGVADIRGGLRVLGAAPDAGAYEGNVAMLFSDGFELRGALRWSETMY